MFVSGFVSVRCKHSLPDSARLRVNMYKLLYVTVFVAVAFQNVASCL